MFTTLFAAADPATFSWSPKCAVVMIDVMFLLMQLLEQLSENQMKVLKYPIQNSLVV